MSKVLREISATFGLYSRRAILSEVLREISATFGLYYRRVMLEHERDLAGPGVYLPASEPKV